MQKLRDALASRPYPGRGCLAARTASGELAFGYFLTGRSDASRQRALGVAAGGDVVVRAIGGDAADPLRHYTAAARRGDWLVVGNGDHVAPIAEALAAGQPLAAALAEHYYEPDPPIFTSRILLAHVGGEERVRVGFVERSDRPGGSANRVIWTVEGLATGEGVLMTTYAGTAAAITRATHPIDVRVEAPTAPQLGREMWDALPTQLRVAALVLQPGDARSEPVIVQAWRG